MGTYLYSIRKAGQISVDTPKGRITANPIRFLYKFSYVPEIEQRQQMLAERAERVWDGQKLPEYIVFDEKERKAGELLHLVRFQGTAATWVDCYPLKGVHEAYIRFEQMGKRLKPRFVPAKEGLIENWLERAAAVRRKSTALLIEKEWRTGEDLAVKVMDKVVAWLRTQDIPPFANCDEWNKQAYQKQADYILDAYSQPVPINGSVEAK